METKWNDIKETYPEDGQRVLTWNLKRSYASILTYNEYYQVWYDEDGDDYECELDDAPYWIPLPEFNLKNIKDNEQ